MLFEIKSNLDDKVVEAESKKKYVIDEMGKVIDEFIKDYSGKLDANIGKLALALFAYFPLESKDLLELLDKFRDKHIYVEDIQLDKDEQAMLDMLAKYNLIKKVNLKDYIPHKLYKLEPIGEELKMALLIINVQHRK